MVGTNACYGFGNSVNVIRYYPYAKNQTKAYNLPLSNPNDVANPPKRNKFYASEGGEEQKKKIHMVTRTLHVFSFPVYALLHPGSTLSFVISFRRQYV